MITQFMKYIFITLLLNPMILIGIAGGVYIMRWYGFANLDLIIYNKLAIFVPLASAFLYAIAFTHVYHVNSTRVNWVATFGKTFQHLLTIVFVAFCTCCVLHVCNHLSAGKLDTYLRHKNATLAARVEKE